MKEKILFITNLLPFPLDNGGKIKTYNTFRMLTHLNNIDFICFVNSKRDLIYVKELEKLGARVECVYKKIKHHKTPFLFILQILKSIFSVYPYVVSKYSSFLMKDKVTKKFFQNKYKKIYIETLPLFQYVPPSLLKKKEIFVILDQQDVVSEIVRRRLNNTKNIFIRIFLKYEYFKLVRYEKKACSLADLVLAITENDRVKFNDMTVGKCNCEVFPFYLEQRYSKHYSHRGKQGKTILFLGTMSWYPNEDGIVWFYNNVFQKYNMRDSGWNLIIVGSEPGPNILNINDNKFVRITGYVDDIKPYLKDALVGIVPLRIGGGMRIKILDLFSFGMPIISTSIGCEGIPVINQENILIANSPEEFINALNLVSSDEDLRAKLSLNAIKLIEREYSFSVASKKFSKLLKNY